MTSSYCNVPYYSVRTTLYKSPLGISYHINLEQYMQLYILIDSSILVHLICFSDLIKGVRPDGDTQRRPFYAEHNLILAFRRLIDVNILLLRY